MRPGIVFIITIILGDGFWNVNAVFSGCEKNPMDLVFLLDGSGSVHKDRFELMKKFIQSLLWKLNVGENATRVALMQFSDRKKTKFEFQIDEYYDVKSMVEVIKNITYQYGALQETGFAFRTIETEVFNGNHLTDRPWARNVLVLITEGPSTYVPRALKEAGHLKNGGIQLVAIGIGKKIMTKAFSEELKSLASSPQDVFLAKEKDLGDLTGRLHSALCPNTSGSPSLAVQSRIITESSVHQPSTITVTSTLVKTFTRSVTLYTSKTISCPVASKNVRTHDGMKTKQKAKGQQLVCFKCKYDEAVAKEFSIECDKKECNGGQSYCADATLEHHGRRYIKKMCASSQQCNSTAQQCAKMFDHPAEFTDCRVDCCQGALCNPYNDAPSMIKTSLFLYIPYVIVAHLVFMG